MSFCPQRRFPYDGFDRELFSLLAGGGDRAKAFKMEKRRQLLVSERSHFDGSE